MQIKVAIDKKLMSCDKDGNRPEIINHIISYPDIHGRIRHNTEDEIKKLSLNLIEVVSEAKNWHIKNPVVENKEMGEEK